MMNKGWPDWLNMFSDKSLKVLYNLTFVFRCAFYAAVVGLLMAISQDVIAIRFALDNLDSKIKRPAAENVGAEAVKPAVKKSQ